MLTFNLLQTWRKLTRAGMWDEEMQASRARMHALHLSVCPCLLACQHQPTRRIVFSGSQLQREHLLSLHHLRHLASPGGHGSLWRPPSCGLDEMLRSGWFVSSLGRFGKQKSRGRREAEHSVDECQFLTRLWLRPSLWWLLFPCPSCTRFGLVTTWHTGRVDLALLCLSNIH